MALDRKPERASYIEETSFRLLADCNDDGVHPETAVRRSYPDLAVRLGGRTDNPGRVIGGSDVRDNRQSNPRESGAGEAHGG